jgi:hypothetical protein
MRRKLALAGPAVALALLGITCAPHDPSGPPKKETPSPVIPPPLPVEAQAPLKDRLDAAIKHVRQRDLRRTHSFWAVFHGILGLGPEHAMLFDPDTGKRQKAFDYICAGGKVRGLEFVPTKDGLDVVTMAGSGVGQGHQDQFVAEMVQWGVPPGQQLWVENKEYTFADFYLHSKMRASVSPARNQELSWAVVIIATNYGTDHAWTNLFGEKLTLEDVVRYETAQPIDTAACGGTHRLFGLTWALHLHLQRGGRLTGVWRDAAAHLERYKQMARKYRNPDGSFSTRYVSGPGNDKGDELRISTSGHVLEWLALVMTDAELREPWMQESANALAIMILNNANQAIDGGALYHAVHGLSIYRTRLFGPDGPHPPVMPLPPREMKS